MKWISLCVLAVAACGAGDDTTDGARAKCASGGAINACPDADRTPRGACWRMVDCSAIPLDSNDPNVFDWGNCVFAIESLSDTGEQLTINCIAASSCDQLKSANNQQPNRDDFFC